MASGDRRDKPPSAKSAQIANQKSRKRRRSFCRFRLFLFAYTWRRSLACAASYGSAKTLRLAIRSVFYSLNLNFKCNKKGKKDDSEPRNRYQSVCKDTYGKELRQWVIITYQLCHARSRATATAGVDTQPLPRKRNTGSTGKMQAPQAAVKRGTAHDRKETLSR